MALYPLLLEPSVAETQVEPVMEESCDSNKRKKMKMDIDAVIGIGKAKWDICGGMEKGFLSKHRLTDTRSGHSEVIFDVTRRSPWGLVTLPEAWQPRQ